ncbi:MAG: hypothetical protein AABZ41_01885, partial [Bacteroidota bacterium]
MPETIQQKLAQLEKRVGPNSKSPLFAQLASFYLLAGRGQDALRVCDEGIANFPFYTTGHLVKAKVLLTLNMNLEARRELEIVHEFLPTNTTINRFLAEIPGAPGEIPGAKTIKPKARTVEATSPVQEPPLVMETTPEIQSPDSESSTVTAEAPQVSAPQTTAEFFGVSPSEVPTPEAIPAASPESAEGVSADPFGFDAPPAEAPQAESAPPADATSPFGGLEAPTAEPPASAGLPSEEESFEQYAARKRIELAGTENTMSLEDFVGGSSPAPETPNEPAPSAPPNEIEELTQKLQGAKKITPVINLADRSTVTASESDTPAGTGFVTP